MFESIEAALARGDAAAALAAAQQVVMQHPNEPRALHLLGIAQRLSGDLQGAAASFDSAIALAPEDAQLHFARAMLALSGNDSEAAAAALDQTLAQDPNALAAYVLRGHTAIAQGDRAAAETELRLAQRVNPEHPHVLALAGNIALTFGEPQDALRPLTQAVQSAPDDAFALSCLGLAFLATGNPAFAEQSLRRALEKQPAARRLRWALIDALRQQEQFAEALNEVEGLVSANPNDEAALTLRGDLQLSLGELDASVDSYRRVLQTADRAGGPLSLIVAVLLRRAAGNAARALFEETLAARPAEEGVWRAGLLLESAHAPSLLQYAGRWLAQIPDSPHALLARAEAAERIGDLGAAEDGADMLLGIDPGNTEAHFIKLRAELRTQPEAALPRIERLLAAARNVTARRACLSWRGFILDAVDQPDKAAQSWIEARRLPLAARPLPDIAVAGGETLAGDEGSAPRLLWGPPGSPLRQVVGLLQFIDGFAMLDDRFGLNPRPDGLGPARPDGAIATQLGWRTLLQRGGIDPAHALDWLPHFDSRIAAQLPDARLLAVLADPRDLLLNWLAYGCPQDYIFPTLAEAGSWLAQALEPLAERQEAARPDDLLIRLEALQADPAGSCRAIAAFCGLGEQLDGARLQMAGQGLGGQPLNFPAGRWKAYAEALAEGFAPLHAVAERLGYAGT